MPDISAYDGHIGDLQCDAQTAGGFANRAHQLIADIYRYRKDSPSNDRASVPDDFERALDVALGDLLHDFNALCSDGEVRLDPVLRRIETERRDAYIAASKARDAILASPSWAAHRDQRRAPVLVYMPAAAG